MPGMTNMTSHLVIGFSKAPEYLDPVMFQAKFILTFLYIVSVCADLFFAKSQSRVVTLNCIVADEFLH